MFGQNELTKPHWHEEKFHVKKIFDTIQGEGPFAGLRATFIRLAGCNLRCYFCDTDFENGDWMTIGQIEDAVPDEVNLVVITGGEPMLQDVGDLLYRLGKKHTIQIETAGTVCPPGFVEAYRALGPRAHLVISPKTGEIANEFKDLPNVRYKYIIGKHIDLALLDGLPVSSTQRSDRNVMLYRAPDTLQDPGKVFVQPCDDVDRARTAQNIQLCVSLVLRFGYRLSLQTHKIIGVE